MQTNEWYSIELLGLDNNAWNQLILCKQMKLARIEYCIYKSGPLA